MWWLREPVKLLDRAELGRAGEESDDELGAKAVVPKGA